MLYNWPLEYMRNLNDEELITLIIKTADQKYSNTLYTRHRDRVFTTCLLWMKDDEIAADCTQDVFVKVFQKLSLFNSQSSFATWLAAISRNHCADKLRQQKRIPVHLSLEEGRLDTDRLGLHEHSQDPFDVSFYMHQLRLEDQQILHLKYEQEVKIDELAKRLGLTISAVKMRLKRARSRLKDAYDRENMGKP